MPNNSLAQTPSFTLLNALHKQAFPSASSIECYNGKLYITGDDAAYLLVTNTQFQHPVKLPISGNDEQRIAKKAKADYEASVTFLYRQKPHLLVLGSGSKPQRRRCILLDYETRELSFVQNENAYLFLEAQGFEELNIESAAMVGDHLLLGSRGHKKRPGNQIAMLNADAFLENNLKQVTTKTISFTGHTPLLAGLSGLCYLAEKDILLFTASVEDTDNAYDDGKIGESFIGGIYGFSHKLDSAYYTPDFMMAASAIHPCFAGEKLEGITAELAGEECRLYVVSDDDAGHSGWFTLQFTMPQPSPKHP